MFDVKSPPLSVIAGLLLVIRQSRAGFSHQNIESACTAVAFALVLPSAVIGFLTIRDHVDFTHFTQAISFTDFIFKGKGDYPIFIYASLVSDNLRDFGLWFGRSSLKSA